MKTIITEQTLVDLLVVLRALPQDEIDEIETFSGDKFDVQAMALRLAVNSGPKWTIRVKETREPIVVGGLIQVGTAIWRTWFFANPRAWEEYGREVTVHTAKTRKMILEGVDHARIETVCLASREKARKWYEACGMTLESELRGYGANGETAVMYTSTKGARD